MEAKEEAYKDDSHVAVGFLRRALQEGQEGSG